MPLDLISILLHDIYQWVVTTLTEEKFSDTAFAIIFWLIGQ